MRAREVYILNQVYATGGVIGLALASVVISNLLRDRGLDSSLSRCFAGALGGAAFLAAVSWLDQWMAILVSGAMTLLILALRLKFPKGLRGTSGRRPDQAWAEVTYALGGTMSLAVGWLLLGNRWLAFLPIAFMGWGDNAAGFARASIWRDHPASPWPSIVMMVVCLGTATLFHPFWVGAVGGVVATAVERYRPMVIRVCDDNLLIVATSLAVMIILSRVA